MVVQRHAAVVNGQREGINENVYLFKLRCHGAYRRGQCNLCSLPGSFHFDCLADRLGRGQAAGPGAFETQAPTGARAAPEALIRQSPSAFHWLGARDSPAPRPDALFTCCKAGSFGVPFAGDNGHQAFNAVDLSGCAGRRRGSVRIAPAGPVCRHGAQISPLPPHRLCLDSGRDGLVHVECEPRIAG